MQYRNKLQPNTTETPQNSYLAKTRVGESPRHQPAKTNRAQIQARAQQIDSRNKLAKRNCKKACGEKRKPTTQLIQPPSKKTCGEKHKPTMQLIQPPSKNPCGEKREIDKEKLKTNKNTNNELNSKKTCGEKLPTNKRELKHQLGAQAETQQLTMQISAHGNAAKKTTDCSEITNNTNRRTRAYGDVDERPAGSI